MSDPQTETFIEPSACLRELDAPDAREQSVERPLSPPAEVPASAHAALIAQSRQTRPPDSQLAQTSPNAPLPLADRVLPDA